MKAFTYLLVAFATAGFIACSGDLSPEDQYDQDIMDIQEYLTDKGLTAEVTSSGLHYIISNSGSGTRPSRVDDVAIYYTGYLLNDEVFDSYTSGNENPIQFPVSGVISGFAEGLQLIGEGGQIKILIPSYLAYGSNPPAGTIISEDDVLIFDIDMVEVR